MTAVPSGPARSVRGPHRLLPGRERQMGWAVFLASAVAVFVARGGYRSLTIPIVVMVNLSMLYFVVLWRRDGELPLFEVGSLCVAAMLLYSSLPFIGFMVEGLTFNPLVDNRLSAYSFNLAEVTAFAWRYVVYMASFIAVYLYVRGRHATPMIRTLQIPPAVPAALLIVLAVQYAFQWALAYFYGVRFDAPYAEILEHPAAMPDMPYF